MRLVYNNLNVKQIYFVLTKGGSRVPLALLVLGEGEVESCSAKFCENCPCSHNNNTSLIKQISLFDTALAMTNT